MQQKSEWFVYIIECGDKTLYTGITTDLKRRIAQHVNGKGAKYTKGRGKLKIIYSENGHSKSTALRREIEIKKLKREEKLFLCRKYISI